MLGAHDPNRNIPHRPPLQTARIYVGKSRHSLTLIHQGQVHGAKAIADTGAGGSNGDDDGVNLARDDNDDSSDDSEGGSSDDGSSSDEDSRHKGKKRAAAKAAGERLVCWTHWAAGIGARAPR